VLTVNREVAERCFVAGLAERVDGNPVFKEWANSWARCVIVRNAIRIIVPHIDAAGRAESASHSANNDEISRIPLHEYALCERSRA